MANYHRWTNEQIQYLENEFRRKGDVELSMCFTKRWPNSNFSKKTIEKKRYYLQLHRTKNEVANIKQRNVSLGLHKICPVKAWDVRGRTANGITRLWGTSNGSLAKFIKVNGRWVRYSRWLYEYVFGPIPYGCIVRLKDGDPDNVTIHNLILLNRSTHAAINSINRCPEISATKKIIHLINKSTKQYEKQASRSQ